MHRTPAVVCADGMGINALATVRSLGRRGVPVHVVAATGSPQIASASRYCTSHTKIPDAAALFSALSDLGQRRARRPVLYVDNDAMIKLLAPHAAILEQRFDVVDPIVEAPRLTDKAFQLRVAQEAGIPVPRTWFPASWAELHEIDRQTTKRLIAKPSAGRLAAKSGADFKVLVCASAHGLAAQLRARGASPGELLVQEYIEGDDACIHVALGYRSGGGRCFVLSAKKLRQTQPGAGVMAVGQAVDTPEVRDMTRRLASALRLRGAFCTEFKLDPSDGKFYFIEWNPRPAYFQSLGWKADFDLAWLAYCDHVEPARLPDWPLPTPSSHYWINVRGDLQHLSRVPRLALLPRTWAPYFGSKEWAVFTRDDPGPWISAMSQLAGRVRKKLTSSAHGRQLRGASAKS